MKTTLLMGVAMLIVGSGLAQAQQSGTKTELQRHDLSVPRREVIQVRVDFDPGYVSPKHTHPGEEIVYVLEGSLEHEVEGKPPVRVKAGDVLFVPAGTVHAAKNVGSGNGAEFATYVVEKGKPLIAVTVFPGEQYEASRSWTERAYPKLIHYNRVANGGHFAAWEQPELFAHKELTRRRP
jgi:quercetin dioxygenase-like cupin family protein